MTGSFIHFSSILSCYIFVTGYRQKATGQKATERNVKMLLSCQDVLERLRVVLKTVEQIVLSSVLVCLFVPDSFFKVY